MLKGIVSNSDGGSGATSVVIADDTTTNATVYPTWVAGTGAQALKISTTKVTFNPSTGILTSTGFAGSGAGLTGTAAGLSIGGNAATATSATTAGSATTATTATNVSGAGTVSTTTIAGTVGTFTKATAGDSVVFTNGGASNKTGYLGTDNSGAWFSNGAALSAGALYITSTATTLYGPDLSKTIAANNSGGVVTGTLAVSSTISTVATSSTGTAVILDGSNILRPLTSSERFKANVRRGWSPTDKQAQAFLSLSPIVFDYKDQTSTTVQKQVTALDGAKSMQSVTTGENLVGVKNVLGFSAEEMNAVGLSDMLNYDDKGLPLSLREHGVLAFMQTILKSQQAQINTLTARLNAAGIK